MYQSNILKYLYTFILTFQSNVRNGKIKIINYEIRVICSIYVQRCQ